MHNKKKNGNGTSRKSVNKYRIGLFFWHFYGIVSNKQQAATPYGTLYHRITYHPL